MAKKETGKRNYTTITIPTLIYRKIQSKIRSTSFSSVSDYVTYVLRETGSEVAIKKGSRGDNDKIIEKLKALGYS